MNRTPTQTACTDAHNVSQHTLNRMITFHRANTRGSRAHKLRIARIGVLRHLSSTCHVSFLAAPDTDHQHKLSLTYLTYLSVVLSHSSSLVHDPEYPAMIHGRVADQLKSHLPHNAIFVLRPVFVPQLLSAASCVQ